MQEASGKRGNWLLTQESFEALLGAFDADREVAAQRYESLRQRLLFFFHHRQFVSADSLADEVLNRIAKRIESGEPIAAVEAYAYGVAKHVAQEDLRRDFREARAQDAYLGNILAAERTPSEDALFSAMEQCLESRPAAERELLLAYYVSRGQELIDHRRQLATSLRLTPGALRKRVFRLRSLVEACVRSMMQQLEE